MTGAVNNSGLGRERSTIVSRLTGMALLAGCCLGFIGNPAQAQELWFAPVTDTSSLGVDKDYQQLFLPNSPWRQALSHTGVFMVPGNYFGKTSAANLYRMFAFLKQHHVAVALRLSMVLGDHCGQGVEGVTQNPKENYAIAKNYKKYGADVKYIVADSALSFGHYATGIKQCRYSMQRVAASMADAMQQVHMFYPNAQVVDTEADRTLPASDMGPWIDTLKAALGKTKFFFHFDVQWFSNWQPVVPKLVSILQQHGIGYGVQFRGTGAQTSDASWIAQAKQSVQEWDRVVKLPPAHPMIQSWNVNPTHVLPESDPKTMTSLINWYCANARQPACR